MTGAYHEKRSKLRDFWDETPDRPRVDLNAQALRAENARRFREHLARCPRPSHTA
jgi:hypothetical protein